MGYYYRKFLPWREECSYRRLTKEKIEVELIVVVVVVIFYHPLKNVEDEDEHL